MVPTFCSASNLYTQWNSVLDERQGMPSIVRTAERPSGGYHPNWSSFVFSCIWHGNGGGCLYVCRQEKRSRAHLIWFCVEPCEYVLSNPCVLSFLVCWLDLSSPNQRVYDEIKDKISGKMVEGLVVSCYFLLLLLASIKMKKSCWKKNGDIKFHFILNSNPMLLDSFVVIG